MASDDRKDNKMPEPLGLPPDLLSMAEAETEKGEAADQITLDANNLLNDEASNLGSSEMVPEIAGYHIDRKLGQGGMGSVFLATDNKLKRKVAIKIVSHSFQENSELLDRFESEIQTLAGLRHPNIAQLYSAGSCQNLPYFVMEFVDGQTLESHATQPLPAEQVAQLVRLLCDAVTYCHENGVLHRDLKPANVLLDDQNQPKIADFGLAKAMGVDSSSTRTGEILGTPGYMAPEQASGVVKSFTAACDIYALGAILYRLMSGRPPFVAAEPLQAIMQVLSQEPVPPRKLVGNIPLDLQTICLKCLAKKPGRRYQSARELRDDLQCFLDGKPISARPAGVVERSAKWVKRNPAKTLLASSIGVLAIAMLLGLFWHNQVLSDELAKTKRLADHGGELSKWLINDHLETLNSIGGTTQPRLDVAARVREFLDASYTDIPPDPKYTRNLGRSYARLASITGGEDQNNLGDHHQAAEYYLRALELYDQAAVKDRNDTTVKKLRASSLLALSYTYLELEQPAESERYFDLANEAVDDWKSKDWETLYLKLQLEGRKALSHMGKNQFEAALTAWNQFDDQLTAAKDVAIPKEYDHQQIYLATNRGDCLTNLGRYAKADAAYHQAVEHAERTATANPENVLFQRRWSTCLARYGNNLFEQEKATEALEQFNRARDICKRIVEMDPNSVEAAIALASKHTNISDVSLFLGEVPAANDAIQEAIEIYSDLQKSNQLALNGKRQLAISLQSKANILMLLGEADKAATFYERHETLCQGMITTDLNSIPELTQLAENHFQRSLLQLSGWMEKGFDPETARTSEAYKEIVGHLDQCKAMFTRIAKVGPLTANQQAYQEKIGAVRNLIEETIDQLINADDSETDAD